MICRISKKDKKLRGTIHLTASKSESNRLLIIRALCDHPFDIVDLATAQDTQTLQNILAGSRSPEPEAQNSEPGTGLPQLDAGAAGTTMRFLTAFFAAQPGRRILTGSERMKQRPIGILVNALRELDASIEYTEQEGYPPLHIEGRKLRGGKIEVDGSVSSQFISALLMIAPVLENGLELYLQGEITSRPYVHMTLRMMEQFGIKYTWNGNVISIAKQQYRSNKEHYKVEADWSAASYYYSMAALADDVDLVITGLKRQSLQGDSIVAAVYEAFGVRTEYMENGIRLMKTDTLAQPFNFSFDDCPDIAQTVAVTVAALKIPSLLEGLHTLKIKETDRINALQAELTKMNAMVEATPASLFINAMNDLNLSSPVLTYDDHRMAMAFAPLALRGELRISHPGVVSKSYPDFWDDLRSLGFEIVME